MGLIGASLALRLAQAGHSVTGSVRSAKSRDVLQNLGFTEICTDAESSLAALRHCDVLALGLNINDCYPVLDRVLADDTLRKKLVVFDMCSSKKEICEYVHGKYPDAVFVGTHPMAGKEKQGPDAAEAGLFEGSTVFIVQGSEQNARQQEALSTVCSLWHETGALTVKLDADRHDQIMAYVSHGLHLAACLIAELSGKINTDDLPSSPAAGSYRDMTRIAASSGEMWKEITASNREHVAAWLRGLSAASAKLAGEIENGRADIPGLFAAAAAARTQIMHK